MSIEAWKRYHYSPLDQPEEIRLVILHPKQHNNKNDSIISIDIVHTQLGACNYEALSYVWGSGTPTVDIEVKGAGAGKLMIGDSLHGALLRLQGTEGQRMLWIDALCIDQENLTERSMQVRRMGDIFGNARSVIIWLGEAADDSDLAIKLIQNLTVGGFDRLKADGRLGKDLRAVAMLMRRPWFARRWIVQEVAFAKEARVICGPNWIYWDTFSEGVTLFADKVEHMPNLFPASHYRGPIQPYIAEGRRALFANIGALLLVLVTSTIASFSRTSAQMAIWTVAAIVVVLGRSVVYSMIISTPNNRFQIGEVRGVGAHGLVIALDHVFRKGDGEANRERLCTMEELLSYLTAFQASKPHDIIYALASLARDSNKINPDYNKYLSQVCKDVIEQAVETSGSLNIICRPWAPDFPDSPSWIPNVSSLPLVIDSSHIYVRNCADTLVGPPNRRIYKACGSKRASPIFPDGYINGQRHLILSVLGFQLSGIEWLGDPAVNGIIPGSWVALRVIMRDQFWRTLVANRDQNGNMPYSWYRRACEESCERCGNQSLDTMLLLRAALADLENQSSTIVSFLKRVQSVTWNRRLVKLQGGSLGLVPEATRLSDAVCILYGCDVPVVLRKLDDGLWSFIGEAYIHGKGIMDGDAVNQPHDEICFNIK